MKLHSELEADCCQSNLSTIEEMAIIILNEYNQA